MSQFNFGSPGPDVGDLLGLGGGGSRRIGSPPPADPVRDLLGLGPESPPPAPPTGQAALDELLDREVNLDFESKSQALSALEAEMARSRAEDLIERATVGQGNYNNPKSFQDFVQRMDDQGYYAPSRYQAMFDKTLFYRDAREIQNMMTFQCTDLSFPGKSFRTAEVRTYGAVRRPVIDAEFSGELTMTFRLNRRLYEARFFEQWMDKISSTATQYNVEYYENYISNLFIDAMDKDGKTVLYRVKVREAYPKSMDSISLGFNKTNEIASVNITLAYRDWQFLPNNPPDPDRSGINFNRQTGPPNYLFESEQLRKEAIRNLTPGANIGPPPPGPGDIVI